MRSERADRDGSCCIECVVLNNDRRSRFARVTRHTLDAAAAGSSKSEIALPPVPSRPSLIERRGEAAIASTEGGLKREARRSPEAQPSGPHRSSGSTGTSVALPSAIRAATRRDACRASDYLCPKDPLK